MSSYYKERQKANVLIDDVVNSLRSNKGVGSVPALVLRITKQCQVGDKVVYQRLGLLCKVYEDMLVEGDEIKWS